MKVDRQATRRAQTRHAGAVRDLNHLFGYDPAKAGRIGHPKRRPGCGREQARRRHLRLLRSAVIRGSWASAKREGWLTPVRSHPVPNHDQRLALERAGWDALRVRHQKKGRFG